MLERRAIILGGIGILLFAGIGLLPLILGGEFLNYGKLPIPGMEASARRHWGILGIEIGVTITVAATAVSIYYSLRERGEGEENYSMADIFLYRPHFVAFIILFLLGIYIMVVCVSTWSKNSSVCTSCKPVSCYSLSPWQ